MYEVADKVSIYPTIIAAIYTLFEDASSTDGVDLEDQRAAIRPGPAWIDGGACTAGVRHDDST